ncbi:MAG: hypothetical protein ABFD92_18950 [Planctomycetaceae bacterium]|nr:hypothetical protein [Planctomycetaceae bacterium]
MPGRLIPVAMLLVIVSLGAAATTQPAAPATDTKVSADAAMKTPLPKLAINAPLADALAQCAKLAGVKMEVDWESLRATGVKDSEKVVVKGVATSPGEALGMMLGQVEKSGRPLAWYVDKDTVRVTTRGLLLRGSAPGVAAPRDAAAAKPAPAPRDWNFDNAELADVVKTLRPELKMNFDVNWNALEASGVTKQTPVTMHASDITVAKALDLLVGQLSTGKAKLDAVYWIVDEDVVTISTGAALNRETFTRTYQIGDMLAVTPSFTGPRMSTNANASDDANAAALGGAGNNIALAKNLNVGPGTAPVSDAEERKKIEETLIKVVKTAIGEDMWQPQGPGAIAIHNGRMIITQSKLGFLLLNKSLAK